MTVPEQLEHAAIQFTTECLQGTDRFSPCQSHVFVSIGTLESDYLKVPPCGTKWISV